MDRDGKRQRRDGVELEAQLELKITAKAGSRHKIEKVGNIGCWQWDVPSPMSFKDNSKRRSHSRSL